MVLTAWAISTLASCGSGPTDPSDGPMGGGAGASGRTFYVAANQAGADNDRCDGSSPTDLGNGRCPFRDFGSSRTFRLLESVAGVRVEVRSGTYTFPNEGLSLTGTGRTADEGVTLTAYNGETVTFDGEGRVNGTVRVSGSHVTVSGITFVRGGGYNLEVRGGQQVRIVGNRFLSNGSSDSLKGSDGASDVEVRGNEFAGWDSQAVDITSGARWVIIDNDFHDPLHPTSEGVGAKFGARDIRVAENRFRNTGGVALGGTSSAHGDAYEAFGVVVERNVFERIPGHVATVYSCLGCRFSDNDVSGAERGIRLGGLVIEGSSGCPGGCQPTRDAVVTKNRFRGMVGDRGSPSGLFWLVEATEQQGLSAGDNTYCVTGGQPARFAYANAVLTFAQWVLAVRTDDSSVVASSADPRCTSW